MLDGVKASKLLVKMLYQGMIEALLNRYWEMRVHMASIRNVHLSSELQDSLF